MFPDAAYSSIEIPLRQDDRYVLYTAQREKSLAFHAASNFWNLIFVLRRQHLRTSYSVRSPNGPPALQAERREDDMTLIVFAAKGNPELATELSNQVLAV